MTDLQVVANMLGRAGILCTLESTHVHDAGVALTPHGKSIVIARADPDTPNTYGYLGFFSILYFTVDGALAGIGAWE